MNLSTRSSSQLAIGNPLHGVERILCVGADLVRRGIRIHYMELKVYPVYRGMTRVGNRIHYMELKGYMFLLLPLELHHKPHSESNPLHGVESLWERPGFKSVHGGIHYMELKAYYLAVT